MCEGGEARRETHFGEQDGRGRRGNAELEGFDIFPTCLVINQKHRLRVARGCEMPGY